MKTRWRRAGRQMANIWGTSAKLTSSFRSGQRDSRAARSVIQPASTTMTESILEAASPGGPGLVRRHRPRRQLVDRLLRRPGRFQPKPNVGKLLIVYRRRRVEHQIHAALILGEGDHF